MGFHRLAVPSYFGGLPGGYDYINNALSGTPALFDGAKSGGPNAGTYFIAFGEPATSPDFNRPVQALAENTDILDNLLHRDIAVTTRTSDVTTGGAVGSVILTGPGIFLGAPGTPNTAAGIGTFIKITNGNDDGIVDASGVEVKVTAISDTVGAGFSAGNVTLTISPSIPGLTTYRIYYGTRSNLATLPVDAFSAIKIRGAQEVSAQLEAVGGSLLVGTQALSGSPFAISAGTVGFQLAALNTNANTNASAIAAEAVARAADVAALSDDITDLGVGSLFGVIQQLSTPPFIILPQSCPMVVTGLQAPSPTLDPAGAPIAAANFTFEEGGVVFQDVNTGASTAKVLCISLSAFLLLYHTCNLDSVVVRVQPAAHSTLPALMPRIALARVKKDATVASLLSTTWVVDPSGSAGVYQTSHTITLTTNQNQLLDFRNYNYYLLFQNEGGTDGSDQLAITSIELTTSNPHA